MVNKQNFKPTRTPMPEQPADVRNKNFKEVALGYSKEEAMAEAARCLQCKKPLCQKGCPVEIDIKEFIKHLADGDIPSAYRTIKKTNALPAVCGRVCPQETQCEGACILGKKYEPVAIGRLERFVADTFDSDSACEMITGNTACSLPNEQFKVACIGSGPSSLTVAGYLAARGVPVTVYEALHEVGGVLIYGIPEFRLPKSVVAREVGALWSKGVTFMPNYVGGKTVTVQDLFDDGFDAVFIGVGAGLPWFLNIPGENLVGVYSSNEYLTRVNLGRAYEFPKYDTPAPKARNVAVIGGGNVAMDAARTALRLGAENVYITYRRTQEEMPARLEELHHAIEEGVQLELLTSPIEINGDENSHVKSMTLQVMELGEPDDSGRRRPVAVEGKTKELEVDMVILAVGTGANPVLLEATPGLDLNKWGYIETDPVTGGTSIPGVYAGGDIAGGSATVISAMGAGRRAAKTIAEKLGV